MRKLVICIGLFLAAGLVQAAPDDPVACKASGLHICCPNCEKSVKDALTPVTGVSNISCDRPKKEVSFTADSPKTAANALKALQDAGFGFTFKAGDKDLAMDTPKLTGKSDSVVVKGVHACCGQCTTAIKGLFKDAKVTISGKGAQRDVTIASPNLAEAEVIGSLQKAGFTGVIESKK